MKKEEQNQLDSLERVEDFMTQRGVVLGAIATSADRKAVTDVLAQVRQYINTQGVALTTHASQNARVAALAKQLHRNHIAPVVKFAQGNLRGVPEFAVLGKLPSAGATKKLADAGFKLAIAAKPYLSLMTAAGFPADTLDQLTAASNALNDAIIKREPMRTAAVESTRKLAKLLQQGRDAVRRMDGVMLKRFVGDEPALAAWQAASRVMPNVAGRHPAVAIPVTQAPVAATPATAK